MGFHVAAACLNTAAQSQTAVTAYFLSKQLLLFVFELQDYLLPSSTGILTAVQTLLFDLSSNATVNGMQSDNG